jgi:alginate O-acetyltransferase complex protein AlgJ
MWLNKFTGGSRRIRRVLLAGLMALGVSSAPGAADLVWEGPAGWLFPVWESLDDFNQQQVDAVLDSFKFVNDQLAAHQTTLMVLVVPMKATFYPERLPGKFKLGATMQEKYPSVLARLGAMGIPTFDARATLRAMESGTVPAVCKAPAFYRTDYHWSAQAAEATADASAALILRHVQFLSPPSAVPALGEWVSVRRYGDLAARYTTAEHRVKLGRDRFCVRVATQQAASLIDDEPSEVQVVGNSFVQPYLGFPQKLSNALGRPVSLSWKPGNFGPWATLLEYLESESYRQARPRVILWQWNEPRIQSGPQAAGAWEASGVMSMESWRERVRAAIAK